MDAHPDDRERMLTRWTFVAALGDLALPALLAALALLALGWRIALAIAGVLFVVTACAIPVRFPEAPRDEGENVPLGRVVREALGNRRLLLWLAAAALCTLLDEIWIAFGSLYLRDSLGASVFERSVVFGCLMAGGLVGLAVTERALAGRAPLRVLAVCSAACALAYAGWVMAPTLWLSALMAALTAAFGFALYPLTKAQAYAALPERSATVAALAAAFGWLDLALLPVLAFIADGPGLIWVMVALSAQPLGVLAIALYALRARD